MVPDN